MKSMLLGVAAAAVALGACNKSPKVDEKNATPAEVANAVRESGVANGMFLRAGEWRIMSTLDEMSMPGMPPEAQAEMKRVTATQQDRGFQYCLTPEEAKEPRGKFFGGKEANNCRYDHFTMGNGKIDAEMRCPGEPSGQMVMTMNGTYSPDAYSTKMSMEVQGGHEGTMTMKLHSDAKRIGECTAAEKAAAEKDKGTKG
jgi:Protein of unknown function (DUF3617)